MSPSAEDGRTRPRDCLVVDDSRVVRRIARATLERAGLSVREAANGSLALDACAERLPDCILLDWNMPVMSGIEFLAALRDRFGSEPPVIFCTTENDTDSIVRALEGGAQEYVMKPFDDAILLDRFERLGLL